MIIYLNDFLFENRIDDLKIRYEKEFGKEGKDLFLVDSTKNKAYSEWLFKFYKNNKDVIEEEIPHEHFIVLELMLTKYDKNKFSTPITQIKTLRDFRRVIDEKDQFDSITNFVGDNDVEILMNTDEWLIYKPLTYEVSSIFGNRKSREKNWCTTYNENYFYTYFGSRGGLIYCTNKLDSGEDIAFELRSNSDIIYVWDSNDNREDEINNYEVAGLFEYSNIEVYDMFENYSFDHPNMNRKELEQYVVDYYNGLSWEELDIDKDIFSNLFNKSDYLKNYIKEEIEYLGRQTEEFIERYGYDTNTIIKFLRKSITQSDLFEIFDVDSLEDLEKYNFEGDETLLQLINSKKLNNKIAFDIITEHYSNHTCTDLFEDIMGDIHDMDTDTLLENLEDYVNEDDYFAEWISQMSYYELREYLD